MSPPRQIARMPASLGQRERFRVQENELTLVRGTGFEPATSRVSVWCSTVELTTSRTAVVRTRSRNALRRPQERGAGRRRPGGSFLEIRFFAQQKSPASSQCRAAQVCLLASQAPSGSWPGSRDAFLVLHCFALLHIF